MHTLPPDMRAVAAVAGACEVQKRALPVPRPGEVLVAVHTSAINRADTLQRKGLYPPPPGVTDVLGLELAGTVVEYALPPTGDAAPLPGVTVPGARVMALVGGGGNAEYAVVRAEHLLPVPQGMSLATAGGVPEVWLTAFQLLHFVAKVRAGQTVLIHAAGSGVGTSAVQLAVAAGCRVLATVGSDAKADVARKLGADVAINYKAEDWSKAVLAASPSGVDVILDPVGGSYWRGNADAAAMDGTWVLYGSMGGGAVEGPLLSLLLRKRVSLLSTTLRTRSDAYKAELVRAFAERALPALASGALIPIIDSTYRMADVQAAHAHMESNGTIGKVLLEVAGE